MPAVPLRCRQSSSVTTTATPNRQPQVGRAHVAVLANYAPGAQQWRVAQRMAQRQRRLVARRFTEPELSSATAKGEVIENPDSEAAAKKAQADKLREAEKFMVIGDGSAKCKNCNFEYQPDKGDPEFPIPRGMRFEAIPDDYVCPVCGAAKEQFVPSVKVVAGFAENQKYGLGANSLTAGQKNLLIYGSLLLFFSLFIAGYSLD